METAYVCACAGDASPQHAPRAPLSHLFFCEDCYAVRCDDCVAWEISSCYCPSCLFEVPGTSVRAQKARCARSCFACPLCFHVLSVVASDPPHGSALTSAAASQGTAPFYLYCTSCRWDSKPLGLVSDRPGNIGAAFRALDAGDDEFSRVRHHVAPLVRMNMDAAGNARRAAPAPAAHQRRLLQDLRGLAPRYVLGHPRETPELRDALLPYATASRAQTRLAARTARRSAFVSQRASLDGGANNITTQAQRWAVPSVQPYESASLHPQRVQLQAKLSKRCPACRHILVRPELRTNTADYKLRLLANQYLPSVSMRAASGPHAPPNAWLVTLTNPLMDAMHISIHVKTAPGCSAELSASGAVHVPPYTEAWEVDGAIDAPDVDPWADSAGCKLHRNATTTKDSGDEVSVETSRRER
ncbi:hypothetical protein MSPP1_001644 [Malassezia sp. CBS 17886]|nr:hypothetical protein MSPP1_001644 [Malassezia sp. CBS 17886]